MTNNTYNMMGTTKVGKFSAHTGGFGDSSISTLIRLSNGNINSHISVGISLPTGSTTEGITACTTEHIPRRIHKKKMKRDPPQAGEVPILFASEKAHYSYASDLFSTLSNEPDEGCD